MITMDLVRFGLLLAIPLAHAAGRLSFAQLLVTSIACSTAGIVFSSAAGSFLKSLVTPDDLLQANARFETTNWVVTLAGLPLVAPSSLCSNR